MHIISYVSESLIPSEHIHSELASIADSARVYNNENSITGVLFYQNDHFFQTIEGNEEDIRGLYNALEFDRRHRVVNKLVDQPSVKRCFPDWSMDTFFVDNPDIINPTTLHLLKALYYQNFGGDALGLIEFIKKMVDEMDTFRILQQRL